MSTESAIKRPPLSKRTFAALIIIVAAIPLTIWFGINYLGNYGFYIVSVLMLIYIMLPFVLVFESQRPQARELVVLSVMTALAVASRAAFFMLPSFKPSLAFIIIAAVAFGPEAGFLVGAMTGFVSNFFFGQGPWTPFQMFAFGIIGFIAGVLAKRGILPEKRIPLSIFGAVSAVVLYGGLVNPATLIISSNTITLPALLTVYATGLPFDLIHAAATGIFLFLLSKPMLEKLDRLKMKYGILQ